MEEKMFWGLRKSIVSFESTVDSQKIVSSKFCKFTENRFLRFLTLRIGHNMECQLYT